MATSWKKKYYNLRNKKYSNSRQAVSIPAGDIVAMAAAAFAAMPTTSVELLRTVTDYKNAGAHLKTAGANLERELPTLPTDAGRIVKPMAIMAGKAGLNKIVPARYRSVGIKKLVRVRF